MIASRWITRFLDMAHLVASWSKDPSTQVGAVIADSQNRIVSVGFNGPPRDVDDNDAYADRDTKLAVVLHAEENAILFAPRGDLAGCTIYVTHAPCSHCASVIIQSGIRRVVISESPAEFAARWGSSNRMAARLFQQAGVECKSVSLSNPSA